MTDQPIAATHPAQGGVTAARGFRASGVHAGFRKDPERLDLALVVADEPCACAAVFTKNVFCSAPVIVSRAQLGADQPGEPAYGTARAVVVNSGNANAATGEPGLEAARETARIAGDAVGSVGALASRIADAIGDERDDLAACVLNVRASVDRLRGDGEIAALAEAAGLEVVGGVYRLEDGAVEVLEPR